VPKHHAASDSTARAGLGGFDAGLVDRLAAAEEYSFWFRARNRLIVELLAGVTRPGDRFLEVGCGTGYVLRAAVDGCAIKATGGELSAEALAYARRRVPEAELFQLEATSLPFQDEFQAAGAFDVLEHIEDDVAVLRGLCRAVRPGGHVLITVPQHPWLWSTFDEAASHVRRYRRRELLQRATRAGLAPVRATSFVTSLLPLMALARAARRLSPRRDAIAELLLPPPIDRLLEQVLELERAAIRRGVNLPAGGSLVLLARRPSS
jgi:SAM-dependent methyltransferase